MMPKLFFGYFAVVITVLSLIIVTRKNPVHSVMWMLLMFFHIAGMYLFLNAEFIAAIQVIVYAGAILVLFLFVVLLMNLREELETHRFIKSWPLGLVAAAAILAIILGAINSIVPAPKGEFSVEYIRNATHTKALGTILYTEYLFPFEVASLVLLIAIIGAMVLAKRKTRS